MQNSSLGIMSHALYYRPQQMVALRPRLAVDLLGELLLDQEETLGEEGISGEERGRLGLEVGLEAEEGIEGASGRALVQFPVENGGEVRGCLMDPQVEAEVSEAVVDLAAEVGVDGKHK